MFDGFTLVFAARMTRPRRAFLGAAVERRYFVFVFVLLFVERLGRCLDFRGALLLTGRDAVTFASFVLRVRSANRL